MRTIVAFLIGIVMTGCTSDSDKDGRFGRYVFIDDEGVCHVNSDCPKLKNGKDRYGHSIYAMLPCDTTEFMFDNSPRVCSNCVSSSEFENLKTISVRNKRYEADRQWIYKKLISANYDMESYEEFVVHLSDSKKRKRLYEAALNEGWDIGTFDEFSEGLGFHNIQQDD